MMLDYSAGSDPLRRKLAFWRCWAAIATLAAAVSAGAYLGVTWEVYAANFRGGAYPTLHQPHRTTPAADAMPR